MSVHERGGDFGAAGLGVAPLADDDAGRCLREVRGLLGRPASEQRGGHHRDDGVARPGDVEHLAPIGGRDLAVAVLAGQ